MTARYRGTCHSCSRILEMTLPTPYDECGEDDMFAMGCVDCNDAASLVLRDDYEDGEDDLTIHDISMGLDVLLVAICENRIRESGRLHRVFGGTKRACINGIDGWIIVASSNRRVFVSVFEALDLSEDDLALLVHDRLDLTEAVYA